MTEDTGWRDETPFDHPLFRTAERLAERAAQAAGEPFDREAFRREVEAEARRQIADENREPWQEETTDGWR